MKCFPYTLFWGALALGFSNDCERKIQHIDLPNALLHLTRALPYKYGHDDWLQEFSTNIFGPKSVCFARTKLELEKWAKLQRLQSTMI